MYYFGLCVTVAQGGESGTTLHVYIDVEFVPLVYRDHYNVVASSQKKHLVMVIIKTQSNKLIV